ncbi:hypothetical protein [Devosia sp. Leaf420]|uniref:hypothetical protein n=1 Tax=Devosia sp. Leaf420 TaxID=1736374 RepID=UPI000B066047|nr:hypothetical protein [Devosia sp. Leaf420]
MSQRSAGIEGNLGHANVPRLWIILGFGIASWLLVIALVAAATTAFQAVASVLG